MSYDPYVQHRETEVRHAQVVYLSKVKHLDDVRVAEITGYAVTTVRIYSNIYQEDLEEKSKIMFEETEGVLPSNVKGNWCYWIRVYCDGKHIFDKIGTTTRTPEIRIAEMMRNGWKNYYGVLTCKVMELFDCGSRNPVGLEKLLHGVLISQNYEHLPNDRFRSAVDREIILNTAKMYGYYYE